MAEGVYEIGCRRELLLDDFLAEAFLGKAELRLHSPRRRELVLVAGQPWEGCMNTFNTVFHDGERFRLYYRGWQIDLEASRGKGEALAFSHPPCNCLAFSDDGIHWDRPMLEAYAWTGGERTNIVLQGDGWHGFSPFLDTRPEVVPEARYKAVGVQEESQAATLVSFISADGIHWERGRPLRLSGRFDSHNLVFWDSIRQEYRAYYRDLRDGKRDIRTAVSPDFATWRELGWLEYPGSERCELYTNNVQPYYRAPHLYVGLPARYVQRGWSPTMEALPELEHRRMRAAINERFGTALSDALFMSSRDGRSFRRWDEAFIRPGEQSIGNWTYGDNYPSWGMLETESDLPGGGRELSFYVSEGYWRGKASSVRRYSLRLDGFVSLHAPLSGGEMISRPMSFHGSRLSLNVSTSAAGSMRVELQDLEGQPLPGFELANCWEVVGDTLDYTVRWRERSSVAALAGRPVRLRLVLRDADLYSFCFG